jgi:hypothetical protein
MMKTLDLSKMGITQLSLAESIDIDGGDIDGLMRGKGPNWDKLGNGIATISGAVVGFFAGLFS